MLDKNSGFHGNRKLPKTYNGKNMKKSSSLKLQGAELSCFVCSV